jgi:hypothetical protein
MVSALNGSVKIGGDIVNTLCWRRRVKTFALRPQRYTRMGENHE